MRSYIWLSLAFLLCNSPASYAAIEVEEGSNSKHCSFSNLSQDPLLTKALTFSKDPTGLALQAKESKTNVNKLLQFYANEHNCSFYMLSMEDLVSGLFKGITNFPADASQNKKAGDTFKKFILIDDDKAICIEKLGLKLPVKHITPTSPGFCDLTQLRNNTAFFKGVNFEDDPIGLAVSVDEGTNLEKLFQSYAMQQGCALYTISMSDLMKGLLGSSMDSPLLKQQHSQDAKKYLVITGDKALCIKTLGLKLPLKTYLPFD